MLVTLVGVICAEVNEETVGAVRSMVIVVEAAEFEVGPLLGVAAVSATVFALRRGVRVPSLHPVMVIVKLVPLAALGENVQPVAVPEFAKSVDANPVMDSDIDNVYVNVVRFEFGELELEKELTEGGVVSVLVRVSVTTSAVSV